ncbi:hypothetical protein EGR_09554 [Echinococcus granulosus]|uniref:Uncharacterized protein n=1 Tax=Echinococcus granulosus TaxID=6210 RepID=W6U390_ECHGR|nr:hypothetical protein EGR_09554 [Echinococcus granulosus]EUB55575.1 hypothetical protein EGR_09554 [Echinococcus granulosus]
MDLVKVVQYLSATLCRKQNQTAGCQANVNGFERNETGLADQKNLTHWRTERKISTSVPVATAFSSKIYLSFYNRITLAFSCSCFPFSAKKNLLRVTNLLAAFICNGGPFRNTQTKFVPPLSAEELNALNQKAFCSQSNHLLWEKFGFYISFTVLNFPNFMSIIRPILIYSVSDKISGILFNYLETPQIKKRRFCQNILLPAKELH